MSKLLQIGVLGSGNGSNFQAIIDAIEHGELQAEVALVMSDNADAFILERAKKHGIKTAVINCDAYKQKFPEKRQEEVAALLLEAGVELVCLAGFMRLVKAPFLKAFPEKMINIHPSLLPKYPGLHAWEQAVSDGASHSGATVHLVDSGMDTGKIIAQSEVPVLEGDTAETLHQRIQIAERELYPRVIKEFFCHKN